MAWEDKQEVKKGNIGERIVNEILSKYGYIVYRPISEGAHKIDFFAHKSNSEKKIICIEAKAKKRMCYKTKTGFNYSNYLHYKEIYEKYNIQTYIFFIDDFEEYVYGGFLHLMGEGEIIKGNSGDVIVWPLNKMRAFRELSKEEINELKEYTKENYDYSRVTKYFDNQQLKLL